MTKKAILASIAILLIGVVALTQWQRSQANNPLKPNDAAPVSTPVSVPVSVPVPAPQSAPTQTSQAQSHQAASAATSAKQSTADEPTRQATLAKRLSTDPNIRPLGYLDHSFVRAQSQAESDWMDRNGFPDDLDLMQWNRAELEKASTAGDVKAMNMLTHLKLENGEADWDRNTAFNKYGSAYFARLMAAYHLGLLGPGSLQANNSRGEPKPRNVVEGVAWDLVAQQLGDTSILAIFQQTPSGQQIPALLSLEDLAKAYSLANNKLASANVARHTAMGLGAMIKTPYARKQARQRNAGTS